MASDSSFSSTANSPRRRSTFYVPLAICQTLSSSDLDGKDQTSPDTNAAIHQIYAEPTSEDDIKHRSMECIYNPNLSACSFAWSLDESNQTISEPLTGSNEYENKFKRYGVVLNASVNIDDEGTSYHQRRHNQQQSNASTPIGLLKSHHPSKVTGKAANDGKGTSGATERNGIIFGSIKRDRTADEQPLITAKEKSQTLPHSLTISNSFPSKSSFLLHSTPRIPLNYSTDANSCSSISRHSPEPSASGSSILSPKKSLSFIRRTHSTKLSRSNSLLKSLTSKCVDQGVGNLNLLQVPLKGLDYGQLVRALQSPSKTDQMIKDIFIWNKDEKEEECAVHSDTSYEKACRRGSAPSTPVMGQKTESTSRFTNFFSKRSFRSIPLKRTKSVTKLERAKHGQGGIRGSRSHESLLSNHAVMSTIDLSCMGAIEVVPVHSSVLGRRHCFHVRGIPRGERYYSCGTRQERDLWIYSLRKTISPNKDNLRRVDNSLKMWIYEAKSLPPKKRYFCEIYLDKTLYGRTSVKLRADLLFWGEFFDFPDVPGVSVITINVFREADKKKKREKHVLVGSVAIPIEKVTARTFTEDWYQIVVEKQDSIIKNTSKEMTPTLRIKCRYQSIDILPLEVYKEFQHYLNGNYKKVCEIIEPIISVKAKEDIGQALVLQMHSQGMAAAFLADVVALDLLRVDDQRLTFRGNSLATKSMEAFLKLIGEQYLQDTLSIPIAEIIASDRDCEVDPTKVHGSLSRQQQALRKAVKSVWAAIAESNTNFPVQLRECFSTFRERLQDLDRDDMADNLISASIFLRFLCPAILSPSLFNITNELPSDRATRNLTLVAKTLQTLANFTRFQGKENFMEFLNDFLEQEAPRMKQFLYDISSTDCHMQDNFLNWSSCIDQGKQLSILHSLLSEILPKLPAEKLHELHPLSVILESIKAAKESNGSSSSFAQAHDEPLRQPQPSKYADTYPSQHAPKESHVPLGTGSKISPKECAPKRAMNVFHDNDFPVRGQNNQLSKHSHSSDGALNHSAGPSTVLVIPSMMHKNHDTSRSGVNVGTINKIYPNRLQYSSTNVSIGGGSLRSYVPSAATTCATSTSVATNSLRTEKEQHSNSVKGEIRANTLPRYNNYTSSVAFGESGYTSVTKPVDFEYDKKGDLSFRESEKNMIQIDIDPSNPLNRKSPTPLLKNLSNCHHGGVNSKTGSQRSLLSPASEHGELGKNALSLGIPHSDMGLERSYPQSSNVTTVTPLKMSNIATFSTYGDRRPTSSNPSKMPMSLEDLEDLLNYADEQKQPAAGESSGSASSSGGCDGNGSNARAHLAGNGSSISIGQISNICSSGYQSIPTQSASSSPVELAGQHRIEYVPSKTPPARKLTITTVGYPAGNGIKLCYDGNNVSKPDIPELETQLFSSCDPDTNANTFYHRDNDPEMSIQQKTISRVLNNNYVDSAYDVLPSVRSSLSFNQSANHGPGVSKGGSQNWGKDGGLDYFKTNRASQMHRQKRQTTTQGGNCIRAIGDHGHSESSSDERFSNTTSENYNEADSLTTTNTSMMNRIAETTANENEYDPIVACLYGRRVGSHRVPRTNPLMQYEREEPTDLLNRGIGGSNSMNCGFTNGHRDHQPSHNRYHRRISVECARTLSDSSTDDTESDTTKGMNSSQTGQHHLSTLSTTHHNFREYDSKRRRNANKSVEQCEREIQRLQASLDSMRQKLEMSEPTDGADKDKLEVTHHSDSKIRSIIGRLLTMEEELRQEQYKMSLVLSHKQRVIEAQGQQIAALDAANNRLLSALSNLQNQYENQSNQSDDTSSSHPNVGASSC